MFAMLTCCQIKYSGYHYKTCTDKGTWKHCTNNQSPLKVDYTIQVNSYLSQRNKSASNKEKYFPTCTPLCSYFCFVLPLISCLCKHVSEYVWLLFGLLSGWVEAGCVVSLQGFLKSTPHFISLCYTAQLFSPGGRRWNQYNFMHSLMYVSRIHLSIYIFYYFALLLQYIIREDCISSFITISNQSNCYRLIYTTVLGSSYYSSSSESYNNNITEIISKYIKLKGALRPIGI